MRQQLKLVTEVSRLVFLAATGGVVLVVILVAWLIKSVPRIGLGKEALDLPLTDRQATALLAERTEAAYAREKARKHMLYATNFNPWL